MIRALLAIATVFVSLGAHAFQGEIRGYSAMRCEANHCIGLVAEKMEVSSDQRTMAGAEAYIEWYDDNFKVVRRLKVFEPVFFIASDVITYEGDENDPTKPGFVDLRSGK